MTDLRTAAQQALEALEWHYRQGHSNTLGGFRLKIDEKALRNLKAALAEPVQEPVAWQWLDTANFRKKIPASATPAHWSPLFTAPPQRKPLTDEEAIALFYAHYEANREGIKDFVRAIEAAHGIGGPRNE